MGEIWAVYAEKIWRAEVAAQHLELPEGVTVMCFSVAGPPKYGHRFARLVVVDPKGEPPRFWDEQLKHLRTGLSQDAEEVHV